jgi:hypothetical protein
MAQQISAINFVFGSLPVLYKSDVPRAQVVHSGD